MRRNHLERNINEKLDQIKKGFGNPSALSTEKQVRRKWWKDPKWIISIIMAIILIIISIKQCSNSTVIEDGIQKILDEIGKESQQNNLYSEPHIKEAALLLRGLISKVYNYMAETDQRLRSKGYPDKVKRADVEDKIWKMNEVLDEHVEAALALYSNNPILDKK